MKRFLLIVLILPLCAATTFKAADGLDRVGITFAVDDSTDWMEVWNLPVLEQRIVEYVPAGQSVEDWTEMVTVQFLNVSLDNPADFVALFQESVEASNESASFEVIEQGANTATWEWQISMASSTGEIQSEVTRLIRAKEGWFRIAYTKRVAKLSQDERTRWLETIQSATLFE